MQQTVTINGTMVLPQPMVVTPNALPTPVPGQPYPATPVASVTGGIAPFSYVGSGWPTGMSLSANGVLSGTPTSAPGTYSYSWTVTDSGSNP